MTAPSALHPGTRLSTGAGADTASDHIGIHGGSAAAVHPPQTQGPLPRQQGRLTKEWLAWITSGGGNKANRWEYPVG
uniref:Uncharacterized protein n=1 Tax=Streptomyces sp. NBC_00180 TaxID=2903632 RepID=A0AAU1I8X8_9ACTN